jgi:hypothetical protein
MGENEPYTIKSSDSPDLSDAQRDLLKLLCSIASLSNTSNVRSVVLMELLGLKRREAYEFRLKNLAQKGCIQSRESLVANLEALVK